MGTKQTKGAGPEAGASPQHAPWKRTPTKERGDIFASLMLRSGDRLGRGGTPPPYQRRIGMIQEMMMMAKQGKQDEATEMLKTLRQDLGMESTSLDDVLYRYASFRNLVDPITHDLIISLARYIHCPKARQSETPGIAGKFRVTVEKKGRARGRKNGGKSGQEKGEQILYIKMEGDALTSMEKVCRQLTYHLSPHSRWRRQGLLKRKPQACLKAVLAMPPAGDTLDLSGIPLVARDMERLSAYLQRHAARVRSLELGFTELTDEAFLLLLPALAALPSLETLALNGNRLTRTILRELTDALKDPGSFPSVTWIDLGNNVDIFSLPQPFLVGLRKRCPKQGNLPTILEFGESQASEPESRADGDDAADEGTRTESTGELRSEVEGEIDAEMEIEEMMEELRDFDREVQGREDEMEEDSMWTLEERGKGKEVVKEQSKAERAAKAEEEDDTQSGSSQLSCSSQSQQSSSQAVRVKGDAEDQVVVHSSNQT
ncbi:leucine-rich repeat-containing protein 75A isoform X1 [Scleropages formosus]|uniref:Leucine rich repeat containing 75A n=1 Tax=Scleropages formosus TaxID=113540 RepID=A0A8C9WBD0_SCLFO|nr:leucine-rich repeat-containing protein 75A-like isoform X1 [Scleropages formosus]